MKDKYIVEPRANGKSTFQLIRALGIMCSTVWGVSEAEGYKIALEVFIGSEKNSSV